MKQRNLLIAALLLPLIFIVAWIGSLQMQKLWTTQEVKIAVNGYDPRDLLSGHYINLQTDWANTDCQQFKYNSCPLDDFEAVYRFYLPEKDAKILNEKILHNGDKMKITLLFAYHKNHAAILENMQINGVVWQEWLKNN